MKFLNSAFGRALLCGLAALLVAMSAESAGLLRALEYYSWDARVALLARPGAGTDQIRIIELDQNSLDWGAQENGLQWPWPREVYGLLLDFCKRAGAATVSFDVLFSESSLYGVEDDRALAAAGTANGRLLLAYVSGDDTGSSRTWPEGLDFFPASPTTWQVRPEGLSNPLRASFPAPEVLPGAVGLGMANENPDPDGIFRALRPLVFFAGRPAPALALSAWLLDNPGATVSGDAEGLTLRPGNRPEITIPLDAQSRAILNFRGPAGTHARYSAAAVIQSELRLREDREPVIAPELLRGKHVFFGFTAPALLDLRPAPPGGVFAGVELHATALDNLLSNDFFRRAPAWASVPLAAVFSLGAAFFALRASSLRRLGAVILVFLALPVLAAWGFYRALYWLPFVMTFGAVFLSLAFAITLAYATEGRQRRFLKNAFSQYLSPEVISEIIKDPGRLKLGGEKRELSIYFSDLAGFSSISEKLSPEDLTRLLNEYLSAMTDVILEEGGTIDKYEGDAIIAFWNAPHSQADHALRAVRAALRCQEVLADMQPRFHQLAGREMFMRVGLNTGFAVVGNMGSRSRFDYTMLGDAVNLASRLEGANKEFGTRTMISEAAFAATNGAFAGRELGRIAVVGRQEPTRVLEPMRHQEAAARAPVLEVFARALKAFQAGRIDEAVELFGGIAGQDAPAAAYLKHCQELPASLPADWTGVWKLTGK